jgi:hypothetical protein
MGASGLEVKEKNMLQSTDESLQLSRQKHLKKAGRPTKYNEDIASEIITRMEGGESLLKISKELHMPHVSTIYDWQGHSLAFRDACARAQVLRTHAMVDEGQEILDTCDDSSGNAPVAKAKERANYRLNIAKCRNKADYGDNIQVNQHVVTETMSEAVKRLTGSPVVIPAQFAHIATESDS